jgi:nitrogen regulatory protein PII
MFRGVQREVSLFRRVRVEVAVNDSQVEAAIDAISQGAHEMGGWGRIFVQPLDDVVTIWTGERGPRAL